MNPIVVEPWGEVFQFRVRFMYLAARPLYATLLTANCTLHSVYGTLRTVHPTMCIAHCCTMHTAQCIQYTTHCKRSNVYGTLRTAHYTMNSALLSLDIPLCHCVLVPVSAGYNLCLCLSVFARLFLL